VTAADPADPDLPAVDAPDLPALDLGEFRRHGHALIDWVADYLEHVGERPVREPVAPGEVRARLPDRAPETPEPFDALLRDLDEIVVPGLTHWQHPGWFAYFPAQSSPPAVLGELVAAGLGVQGMLWSTSPAATEIESHVLDWLVDLMGVPTTWKTTGPGGGVLQMSASDSTHTALVVAREQCRRRSGAAAESMVAYASTEAHSSIEKGARVAGYGHVRTVAVDHEFAMDPAALGTAIAADRAAGLRPAFVCSAVGTTGTTAVDPVSAIGAIAGADELWHHVDAAYAGAAMICPELRHHQDGLDTADSYTFNAHKWLATNFDCSVFWVADRSPLIETLSILPPYLRDGASAAGAAIDYRDWHVPLGRRFRALKLWFVLRSFGAEGLRSMIRHHIGLARALAEWVDADPRLEIIAPTPFALVSFRHADGDDTTRRLAEAINADGRVYLTTSEVDGSPFVRVAVGSIRTGPAHVELVRELIDRHA
jgi:aromatic-L-amino-acid decarboxylase